jgi:predicted RNase H-like HicB family nuclease
MLVNQLEYNLRYQKCDVMQYQIFVQSQSQQNFVASVVGMANLTTEGKTEEEAIAKAKFALEAQLARGKFVSVEISPEIKSYRAAPEMKYSGIFANDSSFDDFMDKLKLIRQEANLEVDI